jgi:hypothetical protein
VRLRVDRDAAAADLEMEMAAGAGGVAGFADCAYRLALPDPLASANESRSRQVGVEVAAALAFAVDQEVVAVEDRVIAGADDTAVADRHQPRPAGGGDVEALVDATAVAAGAELADGAAAAVRALDGIDVAVVGNAAGGAGDPGRGGDRRGREDYEGEKDGARQWCSMTRSTMLYSTASSALMK